MPGRDLGVKSLIDHFVKKTTQRKEERVEVHLSPQIWGAQEGGWYLADAFTAGLNLPAALYLLCTKAAQAHVTQETDLI